ncbi:gag/pol protein [Gossypium australe]|uniref:Gag/pol protein n=1 Tax=Gossypium australe TaxID=47621 RepID=A0A5B6UZS5_9ROSI|nr:gag/pol protein [Gossypium australe]
MLKCYAMIDSKKGNQPSISRFDISLKDCPKIAKERENMRNVPYALTVGSIMYATLYAHPNIYFTIGLYLTGMRDYMLVYARGDLIPIRYTDSDF